MKYLLTLILIGCLTANAQTITNASFEDWTNDATTSGDSLHGWTTSERTARSFGGFNSVFKGTDPHDGTYSIHLKNIQAGFIKGNGVATNGKILFNNTNFTLSYSGGNPDTSRSRFFSYWYKYDNSNNIADRGLVSIYKLKYNGTANPDTIAVGTDSLTAASAYTFRSVPMIFRDFVNQPDTTLIILQSSRYSRSIAEANNDPNLGLNNEAVIDSINFSGWVGIDDFNVIKGIRMFPQPATDVLNIEIELNRHTSLTYSIVDLNGRLIEERKLNSLKEVINVSSLTAGRYLLNLVDESGVQVYSAPVSIVR